MFTGQHIDLDKIVSISDARLIEPDGWAASVSFGIIVQLRDKSLSYSYRIGDYISETKSNYMTDEAVNCVAKENLQKDIDELILVWKEYKMSKNG